MTVTSCDARPPCSVTITLPGRVAQVSWITRLRSRFASWQTRNAASTASFAGARMPVWYLVSRSQSSISADAVRRPSTTAAYLLPTSALNAARSVRSR